MMLLYVGPGLSVATIVIVAVVLVIVIASLGIVIMRPVIRWVKKIKKNLNGK